MRFYSEIQETKYKYLDEIYEYPYLIFATDLIHFLTHMYGIDLIPYRITGPLNVCEILPPGYKSYLPHALSPFSKIVKKAVRSVVLGSRLDYENIYEELVPADAENKLERFINHVHELLEKRTLFQMSFRFMYVGRLSVVFYKRGTKDAAYLAPFLIAEALNRVMCGLPPSVFLNHINHLATDIVDWLQKADDGEDSDGKVFEKYSEYEEDFGESDDEYEEEFDESDEEYEGEFDENYVECKEFFEKGEYGEESEDEYFEVIDDEEFDEEETQ